MEQANRWRVRALVAGWLVGGALALLVAARLASAPPLAVVLVLAACAVAAEWRTTIIPGGSRLRASLTGGVIVVAAVVGGPLCGGLVGLAAALADGAPPRFRRPIYAGVQVCMGVAAGAVGSWAQDAATGASADVLAASLATAVAACLNLVGLATVVLVLRGGVRRVVLPAVRLVGVGSVAWLPVPIAAVVAYDAVGAVLLPIVLLPLLVSEALIALARDRDAMGGAVVGERVAGAVALVRALDARDRVTASHSAAVAVYAGDLAERIGLPARTVWRVRLGGLLHDIGKVAVPTAVLCKAGPLDEREWALIREHPVVGETILRETPGAIGVLATVRYHHERPDGRGYPDGLPAAAIPHEASIVAVADAYSAMTHARPYRAALSPDEAIAEFELAAGDALDAELVGTFCDLLRIETESYRRAQGQRFAYASVAESLCAEPEAAAAAAPFRTRIAGA